MVGDPQSPIGEPDVRRDLTGTVVRGAGLAASGFVLGQLLNLAFYFALARTVTPKDFGQLAAGTILVSVSLLFAESGMLAALVQRRDRLEEAANTALIATLLAGLGLGVVALAAAPLVGLFFGSREVALIAAAGAGWVVLRSATVVPDALMQRQFAFARRVIVEPLGFIAFGVTAVITTANGMGVWGLVLGNYAQYSCMVVMAWLLVRWRPHPRLASLAMWRELVGFGRHVVVSGIVGRVSGGIGTAVIGRALGTPSLGQMRYANRMSSAPLGMLINAGSYVLYPAFSRIASEEARFKKALLRSLRVTALAAIPLGLILFPLGHPAAVVLFGERWGPAGYAAMGMCMFAGGRALVSLSREALKAAGRPDVLPRLQLVSAVVTTGLILAFVPLGLTGVAAGVSVSAVAIAVYALGLLTGIAVVSRREVAAQIWPAGAAGALMAAALFAIDRLVLHAGSHGAALGVALLGVEGLIGAAIYAAALAMIAPGMLQELLGLAKDLFTRLRGRGRPAADAAQVEEAAEKASAATTPVA